MKNAPAVQIFLKSCNKNREAVEMGEVAEAPFLFYLYKFVELSIKVSKTFVVL